MPAPDEAALRLADLLTPAASAAGAAPALAAHLGNEKRLAAYLRPHWEKVPNDEANGVRAEFDAELDDLGLVELAVETGYLRADQLGDDVRGRLRRLAASPAVRKYVVDYDFVPVMYLAHRLGVKDLPNRTPPPPLPNAQLRFAAFVAGHRDRATDDLYQEWVRFLDDFVDESDEQTVYYKFLKSGRRPAKHRVERFARLTAGLVRFVTSLADLFDLLDDGEDERYGVFYAYWLAKFFGYKLGEAGYVRDKAFWSATENWAAAARASPLFRTELEDFPADARRLDVPDDDAAGTPVAGWQANIDSLGRAWEATRRFVAAVDGGK
jgi:hypothetical protein